MAKILTFLAILGGGVLCATLPALAILLAQPAAMPGELALVIAPPWATETGVQGVIDRVLGQPIGPTTAPFASFAVLTDPTTAFQAGAWFVFDGRAIAEFCGIDLQNWRAT